VDSFTSRAPLLTWPWLLAVVVCYFTLLEALFAATPGKAAMGLRVVNLEGARPSLRAVVLRNLLRPVDAWPLLYIVGAVSAAWSARGQRLGDRLADTLVVPAAIAPESGMTRRGLLARLAAVVGIVAALAAGALAFAYYGRPPLVVQDWANATNTVWFNSEAPETPPVCGPWQRQSDHLGPSGSFGYVLPRHIGAYTLGAPTWGDGTVTYPISLELLPAAQTDHGGTSTEPVQLPGLAGADAYHGAITLRWAGILGGGWRVTGGEIDC
jgi:hypothetical protein